MFIITCTDKDLKTEIMSIHSSKTEAVNSLNDYCQENKSANICRYITNHGIEEHKRHYGYLYNTKSLQKVYNIHQYDNKDRKIIKA